MDSIITNKSECNSIENSENTLLSNNKEFLNILNNGVKLSSKGSIAPAINMLVENNVISVDKKESIINVLNDNFGLGTQMTPAAALLMIKKGDLINIAKMSDDGRDKEILLGRIDQEGVFTKESSGVKSIDFTPSLIIDSIDITGKLETKNTEGNQLKKDCKNNLGKLEQEVSDIHFDKFNHDITYDNPIQSLEEIAAGVISGKTDIDGTDDEMLVIEDVLDNDVNQSQLLGNDKQVEEKDKKETYSVKKTDTIWDILQEQFEFTEKQANVAIKKLENNTEFLSQLKSKNIDKIYPGETITFSNELLSSLKAQEQVPEVEKGTWSYKVNKGDTPSHILMKYKGVNWGNVEDIAKELNMSVVKLGETITLAKTITLKNGTVITKTDS